jgi:NSS family neurotransmitter:Na+ symporter
MNSFTRIGFILAASGSAVGLGNIWKFPYMVGDYGGSAFVLIYLITIVFVGFSVLVAEILIGYLGQTNAVDSFDTISKKYSKVSWKYAGFSAFTSLIVLTFYSVVIGWILYYLFNTFTYLPSSIDVAKSDFSSLLGEKIDFEIFFHFLATVLIAIIVSRGITKGIEKTNKILMPLLVLILIILLGYSMTLDGFSKSLEFMFSFDTSKITSEAIVQAVGHSFFTLSIGMGAILTYASSLPKDIDIFKSSIYIVFLDTFIAIISGIMLYAFVFEFGASVSSGPGLVFINIPLVFSHLGNIGVIFAILFFLSLAFAGLTSAISLIEPAVAYLIDRFGWTRNKTTIILSSFFFVIGVFAILSYSSEYKATFTFFDLALFDLLDKLTTNILIPIGGLSVAIFVGFVIPKDELYKILSKHISNSIFNIWYFSVRFIAIPALIFTLLNLTKVIVI